MLQLNKVFCKVCAEKNIKTHHHFLGPHLEEDHNMTISEYVEKYGEDTPIASNDLWEAYLGMNEGLIRKNSAHFANAIRVGKVTLMREEGDKFYKFQRPAFYEYPKEGKSAQAMQRIARAFKYKKSLFIYGPAGTGKSAGVRALCHDLNLESSHYPMREGLDTELYLGKEAVVIDEETSLNVTKFIRGKLLNDLEGRVGKDGVRRGVVILIDDIDRAPAEYHEILRHCLEDNAQNIFVPELGININVHPDTRIIATANSAGRGDSTGKYTSVQEMDDSILDRFQRVVEFHFMEKEQEVKILKNKFPLILQAADESVFDKALECANIMRGMFQDEAAFGSFSHRRLVQWFQSLEELIEETQNNTYTKDMLRESTQDWLEWYDQETRNALVSRALDVVLG